MKRALKWIGGILVIAIVALFIWGYAPDTDPTEMRAKYASATSQFIDVGGGLKMHVRDEGKKDGPVLVLLHGSNGSLHNWEPWVKRLADRYRIISVDQIGHGLTGANPSGDYSVKAFIDTLDALMVKLNLGKFALGGNSMGGGIAWRYAVAHPDKVNSLILVDASGPPPDASRSTPIGFKIAQTPVLNRIMSVISPRSLFEKSAQQSVSNQAVITDAVVDQFWELNRYPGNRDATRQRFALYKNDDNSAAVGSIRKPTLILWGDEDKLIPVAGADWFAKLIPGSKKVIYSHIGHLPMDETPDQSAKDVDAFLTNPE